MKDSNNYEQMETGDIEKFVKKEKKTIKNKFNLKYIIFIVLLIIIFIIIYNYISSLNTKNSELENKLNELSISKKKLENKINDLYLSKNELEKKLNNLYLFKEEYEEYLKRKKILEENNHLYKSDVINHNEIDLIFSWLDKKPSKINLLYSSKNDGDLDLDSTFWKKVGNKSPTLVVVSSSNGYRFGGYSSVKWKNDSIFNIDSDSFIFSFDLKKKYKPIDHINVLGRKEYIAIWYDIVIYDKCLSSNENRVGREYYDSPDAYGINGGEQHFKVLNFEIYEIIY